VASVLELADAERVLRLSDFETLDGPDLFVYLLAAPEPASGSELDGGYLDLGALKGNVGAQNYAIPADVDLADYAAVAIWCRRFSVNFTAADLALTPPGGR
jgi:hypothetical protein